MGQFLSADQVQGNAQGMDPYAYVMGNPETQTDPTGLSPSTVDPSSFNKTPAEQGDNWEREPSPSLNAIEEDIGTLIIAQITWGKPHPSNHHLGTLLGQQVEAHRRENPKEAPKGANEAAGVYYITGPNGSIIASGYLTDYKGRFVTYATGMGQAGHAEWRLLSTALYGKGPNNLTDRLAEILASSGPYSILHFVLFSQLDPCTPCQRAFATFLNGVYAKIQRATEEVFPPDQPEGSCGPYSVDPKYLGVSLSVYSTTNQSIYGPIGNRDFTQEGVDTYGVTRSFYSYRGLEDPQEKTDN
jgi:hypothetical protein